MTALKYCYGNLLQLVHRCKQLFFERCGLIKNIKHMLSLKFYLN